MKRLLSILALAAIAPLCHAQTPPLTSTVTFYRFQADPKFDTSGNPVSAITQAFWQTTVTDATGAVIASTVTQGAQWDAVADAAKTVTVNGKTYTYGEVLAAVMAIATQEKH